VLIVPRTTWDHLEQKLAAEWEPGEHVTLIGPTGSGKTHMALTLAELCRYVLVIATKRQDPLVSQLRSHGYHVTAHLDEIAYAEDQPTMTRVVYWPRQPDKLAPVERLRLQATQVRHAIDFADKRGKWAVVIDETMWLVRNLRLERELEGLWFQGRSQGVSVIACSQRPAWVPRLAYSQATYLFIWQSSDKSDLESLRDIGAGFPREVIEENVRTLSWDDHEALFVDTKRRELARVVAPPR
jgi:energy-coupling factor transporter ATP-binding protein EcfA2